jgi:hypothetical protein
MSIPQFPADTQVETATAPAPWPTDLDHPQCPDSPSPACPYCGRAALPFDPRLNSLLDLLDELAQAVRIVKRAVEEVGL